MTTDVPTGLSPDLQVTVLGGELSPATTELARATVQQLLDDTGEHARAADVRLSRTRQAVGRPAMAEAVLAVEGGIVRAQVAADTMAEAIAVLRSRLDIQLSRMEWARSGHTAPDSDRSGITDWRQGVEPLRRPTRVQLPADQRVISRHKDVALVRESTDQAAFTLETMDFDFHLFTESGSGQDSVLYRFGPGPFRLAQLVPDPEGLVPPTVQVTVLKSPAPVLTVGQAKASLDASDHPFLFFADPASGRGAVLYARYDGHYGLISPAGSGIGEGGSEVAEEAPEPTAAEPATLDDRVARLETGMQALGDALLELVAGLEETPGGPPDPQRVRRGVRQAHEALLGAGLVRGVRPSSS
ncbi:sigma 54 modulation/S30EA ribosomal C-terminal domain-containing protein [Streptacidiphilus fuscans]|uniref:Sigma 54 modulation/S30EA ribosomal C-terminal domain-containing protein n=1 Tax=Streptacidiphilus fuscans TaxID=2789292 RepID=A0A931FC38_9ACTN|nr:sigma 54 modulation/S30EA ribosomal C-terminal domain-containing protein [Streptacidiphilus fuscans]MBF9069317.1 sigma 54 modulation/S30EA ribosomal C-terminal domain-containing protein [Streptacidiphilus fuscans]